MNKTKKILNLIAVLLLILSFASCSKQKSPDQQLDDLEKIIEKYEPKFRSTEYGTEEYTKMITEYNKEIFEWAEIFENSRYEKDSEGKTVHKKEFEDVKSRFYELNNRMTRMVLAGIPKPDEPEESEIIPEETE